jgi:hypothetical protein
MKSSRSRSRSKSNRNRSSNNSGGNVVNRVFESSGPEGKVRGTPQQIIEKYNQLARDAHLSNDRVAVENFQQHAEHYTRMLAEAQREIDSRREEQERQNRERQAERDRERVERQEREASQPAPVAQDAPQPEREQESDSNLVETPESQQPKPKRAPRRKRVKPEVTDANAAPSGDDSDTSRAAE